MSIQPSMTQLRLNNIQTCFTGVLNTLQILANSFGTPFLTQISNTAQALVNIAQTVKQNKNDCVQLLQHSYELLIGIISLHIKSETGADFSPSMLNHLGKFTETLHKIHTFVEAQQNKSKIKQFFWHGELSALLKDCNTGLQEALSIFKVQDTDLLRDVTKMQKYAEEQHQQVVELIAAFSDAASSERASSVCYLNNENST
ncbi:hypothetical protein C8R43DRAFT_1176792 [Mycena crocata]|nr:hypothetical protein C8R43DRAFT_1176792 [Mycena crocata]